MSLVAIIIAAVSARYSKLATEAVRDAQQDAYRPILRPVELKDHLSQHSYTLTVKNDGHGPLHDLKLEKSAELITKALAVGEEESFQLSGDVYQAILKTGKAKFTYTDIYHRRFSTMIWTENIPYGNTRITDWKISSP
jgi:hypothetical protein